MKIKHVQGIEILSSSGKPTVQASVETDNNIIGIASVPIGASRGKYEAAYIYDGGNRYRGFGVRKAVDNINTLIDPHLVGTNILDQRGIDDRMKNLDGTPNKQKLGANAILAVSLAAARAAAQSLGVPLFKYLGGFGVRRLPILVATVIAGGKYSPSPLNFEDYLYVLTGFETLSYALEGLVESYFTLGEILGKKYNNIPKIGGGAYAPPIDNNRAAFDIMLQAVESAGLSGKIKLGLDIVGSELLSPDGSRFIIDNNTLDKDEYLAYLEGLIHDYPLVVIEDPFPEDDFSGFSVLTQRVGKDIKIVGDDLFATNTKRLSEGIIKGAANTLLLKPNQIGTLSEAYDAAQLAHQNSFHVMVSLRSSDTNDSFTSDLAVGISARLIKIGSPVCGEKNAKYNRLLEIENDLGKFSTIYEL